MPRRTAWILLLTLLLQWVGHAWAWEVRLSGAPTFPGHCHEALVLQAAPATHGQAAAAANSKSSATVSGLDSHLCCAMGLGMAGPAPLLSLAQTQPVSQHNTWHSLVQPPDLRPPI